MRSKLRSILAMLTAGTLISIPFAALGLGTPQNLRGTITRVAGDTIEIKEDAGRSAAVHLTNDAKVVSVAAASLSDVKPGSFIGTAATPRSDGTLQAKEIHIFPGSMRGAGEGHRAWDLGPNSTMTNGTVAQVNKIAGDALTVNYKGAEKVVTVTPNTEVVTLVPGDRSELRPGDKIFVPGATENPDGSLEASRLTVGKNGLPPPM
jgi:uncharacterized protein DUF5666